MAERCATCVFRPGNPMSLEPGRLARLVEANLAADSALVCHSTLYRRGVGEAVCRGFFDAYAEDTLPLRLAKMTGKWVEDAEGPGAGAGSPPPPA